MVHEVASAVTVPVLGVGGIVSATDVLEFLVAGASAVQIGTANFTDPACMVRVLEELTALVEGDGVTVAELVGSLQVGGAAARDDGRASRVNVP